MIKQVGKGAVTVAAVVALSGCGGTAPDGAKPSASPSPSPTSVDAMLGGTWGTQSATWSSGPGGVFVLRIEGAKVELTGDRHCRGNAAREDGVHVIRLTCDDGNTDRSVGRVYGLTAHGMTVEWEGFGADSFERAT
ncbi:hypothetical protein ACIRP5_03115 [Streptomyces sp. NPDC101221]|uniref:hypothetical protein n=1 Tax=Streptomyces sp. NPDC101221 TaxID=3366132 RepID=UPI003812AAD3